jgi:two-component system NtrC family sensor kinase
MSEYGSPSFLEKLLQQLDEAASALQALHASAELTSIDLLSDLPLLLRQARAELDRLQAEVENTRAIKAESEQPSQPAGEPPKQHGHEQSVELPPSAADLRFTEKPLRETQHLLEARMAEHVAALRESNVRLRAGIEEHLKAEQALQRDSGLLQLLHKANQAILSARSEEEIAEAALRYVPQLLDCARASVWLFDRKAGKASLLAVHTEGETRQEESRPTPIPAKWADMLETLARGEIYAVENLQEEPSSLITEALRLEGAPASLYVPLMIDGELMGVLALEMRVPGPLNPEQETIAREAATQIAIGIQRARLHKHLQRRADDLEDKVRKRTRALWASEARFRVIFEEAAIGIALVDREGRIEECNPALQNILGYSAEELHGKTLRDFSYPDDRTDDEVLYEELVRKGDSGKYPHERRFIRRDGRVGWANVLISRVRRHEGKQRFVVIIEDITEQKQAQEALVQAEKLAVTGRLAAVLAHEINNPLQSVISCLELVEQSLAEGKDARHFLQLATSELERVAIIVGQLRDLSRPMRLGERKLTDVGTLVEQVLALTRNQCQKRQVEVEWQSTGNLPLVMVVPDQIQQVFLNLVLNALEAMPDGGRLEVRASRTDEPVGVCISFTDTGRGIAANMMPYLFEPFYTTKPEGMGLGLYVTRNIVEAYGGHIEVSSREGKGATFSVWLPA